MNNKLEDILKAKQDYIKKARSEGKEVIVLALKDFMSKYPELHCVYWEQYTPYFNDGDPCEFDVNDFAIAFVEGTSLDDLKSYVDEKYLGTDFEPLNYYVHTEEAHYLYSEGLFYYNLIDNSNLKNDIEQLYYTCRQIKDILQQAFGEGRVMCTREGISVTKVDHE